MDWFCSKCNGKAEETEEIKMIYGDVDLPPGRGYRCSNCKIEFLDGDFVVYELNSAEQMLEGK